jgi:hypothetical protein
MIIVSISVERLPSWRAGLLAVYSLQVVDTMPLEAREAMVRKEG